MDSEDNNFVRTAEERNTIREQSSSVVKSARIDVT